MELVKDRMAKSTYGTRIDIGPHQALMEEIHRTAGHVYWLEQQIQQMQSSELVQETVKDGMKLSAWIEMYQEERKMLVNVAKVAISAGVAERQVKLAEEQGKMIAMLFIKFINSEILSLSPEQRLIAPKIARELLLEAPRALQSGEVIDVAEVLG